MSTVAATPDLKQKMGIEHPAYEIVATDFVEEYGTATTLYKHKKSGAELLSVSSDDDNKVFGITFRTPRKYRNAVKIVVADMFLTLSPLAHCCYD
jgi:hypothetical protein